MSSGTINPGVPASSSKSEKPLTLLRLLLLLIKGYFKSIPSIVIWTIVRAVAAFLIVLALHTYFVVVKNEGFTPNLNNPLYSLMAFPGNKAGAAAFWGIAAFLLSSLAGRIWFGGPVKLFADFVSTPDWMIKSFKKAKKSGLPVLFGAIAAAMIASLIMKSNYLIAVTVIGIFLSYISRQQGLWFLFLSTALSDFKKLFMKNKAVNHGSVSVFVLGLILGLALAPFIPFKPYGQIFVAALCIAGIILLGKKKLTPRVAMWALSLLSFQAVLFKVTGVYADDGGWVEAGGTLLSWLNSPGAGTAVAMGLPSSLIALLGALLGGSNVPKPPPIPEVMDYNASGWHWVNENGQWVLYQSDNAGNTYGTGIPQSVFEADPESFGNMVRIYTQPTCSYDEPINEINQVMDNLGRGYTDNFTREGWNNMNNTEKQNSIRVLSRIVADAAGVDPDSFTLNVVHDNDQYLNGSWSPGSRTLRLNSNSLNFDNPLKVIQTMAHELRHAAQGDPNADIGGGQDYRNLITWNDRNENYRTSNTDFTRYSGQLLERDADAFGRDISRAIMQQVIGNKYDQ